MALIFIYVALAAYNVEYLTLGLHRVETMVDEAGNVAILDEGGRIRKGGSKRFVTEWEERRRRELAREREGWGRRHHGGGHSHGHSHGKSGSGKSGKRRRDRDKDKERDRDAKDDWSGYMGEVKDGAVASGLTFSRLWIEGTDAVMDIPLGGVCEVLYGDGRESR